MTKNENKNNDEVDWNDYGYDDDDYEEEVKENKTTTNAPEVVKQEVSANKKYMGVKDLLGGENNNKQKAYNNNYKKNNFEKSNSNQGQRNYKNNNNQNYNKYQQNPQTNQNPQSQRDSKPTFYNNSKKETPLIQGAPLINNNNSYSNNPDVMQKPLFKEREGHFVEIKNNQEVKQQPIVASNSTSNGIQPPVFYGKINKEAVVVEEKKIEEKKKEEFVKKEESKEDLAIPVFVNTKKVEGSNVSLEKDLYTQKLLNSAPVSTDIYQSKVYDKSGNQQNNENEGGHSNKRNSKNNGKYQNNSNKEQQLISQFEGIEVEERSDEKKQHREPYQNKYKYNNNHQYQNNQYQNNQYQNNQYQNNQYQNNQYQGSYKNNGRNSEPYSNKQNKQYGNYMTNTMDESKVDEIFDKIIPVEQKENKQEFKIKKQQTNGGVIVEVPKDKKSLKDLLNLK